MRVFIALRAILARESAADLINAAAHDAINRWYIPEAKKKLKSARGERESSFWEDIIRLFEEYSNPRSAKGRHFGNQAAKKLVGIAKSYNLSEEDIMDMTLQIIEDFYAKNWWNRFNVKDGPVGLVKYMTSIFGKNARYRARGISLHHQREQTRAPAEEGEETPIERTPAKGIPTGLETMGERELTKIMKSSIYKKFRKPFQRDLFDTWMKALQKYGSGLRYKEHVYSPIQAKHGVGKSTLFDTIRSMRKEIASVLSKLGYEGLPKQLASSSDLSLTDSVACAELVRRLARWVVAGKTLRLSVASHVPFL